MRGSQNDISALLSNVLPFPHNDADNATAASRSPASTTTLLETFIPGYGPIHKFILYTLNIDITIIVSILTVLWLSSRMFRSTWNVVWGFISSYFMAEISVSSTDDIYTHLIAFLALQDQVASSRRLMAETPSTSTWELDAEATELQFTKSNGNGDDTKWLNFANQEAKIDPRFTPAIGIHNFWHAGTLFRLRRREVTMHGEKGGGSDGTLRDKEIMTISCFGRSTMPIKKLVQDAKTSYYFRHHSKTIIKRPAAKEMRRYGRSSWTKVGERPVRPMNTVVLDEKLKRDLLADINEYLSPVTARWYANRGIPYRRGYLLHGEPGLGKSSLTAGIAGVFGLDIHVVSLLEPSLTEEDLGMLFLNLPARCIVLLEDIDTAGLSRSNAAETTSAKLGAEGENNGNDGKNGGANEAVNVATLAKAFKRANEQSEEEKKKGISLSGLLNIIDGVASHEGRVLIMTTNKPENLDEALIRPGRIDYQVAFTYAKQAQIAELFERMYTTETTSKINAIQKASKPTVSSTLLPPLNRRNKLTSIPEDASDGQQLTPPLSPESAKSSFELLPSQAVDNGLTKSAPPDTAHEPFEKNDNYNAVNETQFGDNEEDDDKLIVCTTELHSIAKQFSLAIPDDMFSPAEIQGFLLKRKKSPRKALREVGEWVEGMLEVKRKGMKVVQVR